MITNIIVVQLEDYDGYFDVLNKAFLSESDARRYLDLNPRLLVGVRNYQIKSIEVEDND